MDHPSVEQNVKNELTAQAILARRDVAELHDLVEVQHQGWQEEKLDKHFDARLSPIIRAPTTKTLQEWFCVGRDVMKELDSNVEIVPTGGPFEFLDLCCAPGGFSAYILDRNKAARGVGISLPEAYGGHPLNLAPYARRRYEYIEEDILRYDLSTTGHCDEQTSDKHQLRPLPEKLKSRFPLVILDGYALLSYRRAASSSIPDGLSPESFPPLYRIYAGALLISQLIVALETVQPGGTLLVKLARLEAFPAAHILFLLDALSEELVVYKAGCMLAVRSTFYVIARGVCRAKGSEDQECVRFLAGLRVLWEELWIKGPEGMGRHKRDGDLDFAITTDAILEEYIDRLIDFGREVWSTQAEALHELLRRKGAERK